MGVSPNTGPPLQKHALIPRPGGPRCLLDVSRVAGGFVWQEGGPWGLRNQGGDKLDRTVVTWAGDQGSKGGGGVCTSLAVPPQPGPLRAIPSPGSFSLGGRNSITNTACVVGFQGWPLGSKKNFSLGMKLVKLEIRTQEARSREPRTESPWIVHQVLGYHVNDEGSDLSQIPCWVLETPGSLI